MDHITLRRVALQMSHIHRFNGQFGPASLTDHSLRVANLVPANHDGLRIAALMHDVGECVTGDISSPLKPHAGQLPDVEAYWFDDLCYQLLPERTAVLAVSYKDHRLVREADMLDYAWEVQNYRHMRERGIDNLEYHPPTSAKAWMQAVQEVADRVG
jgi:5'-deoxynucleotidase YfbR-like HD superfamily hydrolase